MEFIILGMAGMVLVTIIGLYMYLIGTKKIEPDVNTRIQRGNFWDYKTKKFYKWDELMELKKEREEQNDTI